MLVSELHNLMDEYLSDTISEADFNRLWASLQQEENAGSWQAYLDKLFDNDTYPVADPAEAAKAFARAKLVIAKEAVPATAVVRSISTRKTAWLRYAAAVIIVAGAGLLITLTNSNKTELTTIVSSSNIAQRSVSSDSQLAEKTTVQEVQKRSAVIAAAVVHPTRSTLDQPLQKEQKEETLVLVDNNNIENTETKADPENIERAIPLKSLAMLSGNTRAILNNVYSASDMNLDGTIRVRNADNTGECLVLISPGIWNNRKGTALK